MTTEEISINTGLGFLSGIVMYEVINYPSKENILTSGIAMYFTNKDAVKSYIKRKNKKFLLTKEKDLQSYKKDNEDENLNLVAVVDKFALKESLAISSLKFAIFMIIASLILGFLNKFQILNLDNIISKIFSIIRFSMFK